MLLKSMHFSKASFYTKPISSKSQICLNASYSTPLQPFRLDMAYFYIPFRPFNKNAQPLATFARIFSSPSSSVCTDCRAALLCACPRNQLVYIPFQDEKALQYARIERPELLTQEIEHERCKCQLYKQQKRIIVMSQLMQPGMEFLGACIGYGRLFWRYDTVIIVGRNQKENYLLESFCGRKIKAVETPGPSILLISNYISRPSAVEPVDIEDYYYGPRDAEVQVDDRALLFALRLFSYFCKAKGLLPVKCSVDGEVVLSEALELQPFRKEVQTYMIE